MRGRGCSLYLAWFQQILLKGGGGQLAILLKGLRKEFFANIEDKEDASTVAL